MNRLSGVFLALAALISVTAPTHAANRTITVVSAIGEDNRPSPLWMEALERRRGHEDRDRIAATAKPLSEAERDWQALIDDVAQTWLPDITSLEAPFPDISPPANITVLVGNQGATDGFTHRLDIICTDLSALIKSYGRASDRGNRARLWRILSHEYTHLMTKAWLAEHPWDESTVFGSVLWELYYEGLGMLRSLQGSERWVTNSFELSERARNALIELEPEMVQRLQDLALNPPREEARNLRSGLSMAPFNKKWGALPIALWLALDTHYEPEKLTRWVRAGPGGILGLASEYAAPEHQAPLRQLSEQAKSLATQ